MSKIIITIDINNDVIIPDHLRLKKISCIIRAIGKQYCGSIKSLTTIDDYEYSKEFKQQAAEYINALQK